MIDLDLTEFLGERIVLKTTDGQTVQGGGGRLLAWPGIAVRRG